MTPDTYLTLAGASGPHELREKASRFLAHAAPVASLAEAEAFVTALRKRFHDASHVPWACRLGDGTETAFRYSDDGEPSGTGGAPIHQELVRLELFGAACAVVRYFGGTKLGTGGLTRAFSGAARLALEAATKRTVLVTVPLALRAPFDLVGVVVHVVGLVPGTAIVAQDYDAAGVSIRVAVPRSQVERFRALVVERSSGRVTGEVDGG